MTITFDCARAHPEARQEFLDSLDIDDLRGRISGMYYVGESDTPNPYNHLAPNLYFSHALAAVIQLPAEQLPILVTGLMFHSPYVLSIDDALSNIYDHEGTHIDQHADARHREECARVREFIHGRRVPLSTCGKFVVVDNKTGRRDDDCLGVMSYAITAYNEIPAIEAQFTGRYAASISPALRSMIAGNLDAFRTVIGMMDQQAEGAAQDLFADPLACFEKLRRAPDLYHDIDTFLKRLERERIEAEIVPR